MSNSPLVSYTKISPNKTSPRNHKIDTITIHCVVGQCSVERLGDIFAPESKEKSCNYGIGYDGKIGMYVEEKDRSWCSSNRDNDHRAITIECASDTTHPYAINDKVYRALIDLCADICKRNDIKELKWKGDKSLIGQVDKQNMTVHRWFANKACPGDYIYSRLGKIASEVNAKLANASKPNTTNKSQVSKDIDPRDIWDFFISKGLNSYAVAGLMGNLHAESALKPNNLQNSYSRKLSMSDEEYTAAVDNGSYSNFIRDSAGYGLAQWTYWSRKEGLYNFAKSKNVSISDLEMQLEYLWKELQGYSNVMAVLRKTNSIRDAAQAVLTGYEKPADQSGAALEKRVNYGKTYYVKYAEKTTQVPKVDFPDVPFTVRVLIDGLNYRSDASMNGRVIGQTGKGVFTITKVSNGWGKLKSGLGWIYLENSKYCEILTTVKEDEDPFLVKVSATNLNIRSGAGTNYSKTGDYCEKGVYTITEVRNGTGSKTGWGKLKSGAGWISLDYTTKI